MSSIRILGQLQTNFWITLLLIGTLILASPAKAGLDEDYGFYSARYLGSCYALDFLIKSKCREMRADDPLTCNARIVELLPKSKRIEFVNLLSAWSNELIDTGIKKGGSLYSKFASTRAQPEACLASHNTLSNEQAQLLNQLMRLSSKYRM